jgi:peptidoglycan hydrolase-like protein with peptidoglycan-binding domain
MRNRIALFTITIALWLAGTVYADDNVREVQTKLSDEGFYFGEIDGAYSSDLSAALSRYQIRNGLPISGQLDAETSKALGAKPAVGPSTAATDQSSETWRRLRKRERRTSTSARRSETATTEAREMSSPADTEASPTATETPLQTTPVAKAQTSTETTDSVSAPPATARTSVDTTEPASAPPTGSADDFSTERLHDYVAAYVLAGLDKNVGAETEFFADRVQYYDQGVMDHEKIRQDLKRYDERWPERHFWVAGKINVEPQSENRVRVTFPLGFKLRNGNKQSSGKVDKTLVLEPTGDDLQIVSVNEHKAD